MRSPNPLRAKFVRAIATLSAANSSVVTWPSMAAADAAIVRGSEVPNAIGDWLAAHPAVAAIALENGADEDQAITTALPVLAQDEAIRPDTTAESLAGKSVGVVQGTLHESFARAQWGNKGVNIHTYQTQDQVFSDLINGRLDASFQASVQADAGLLQTPQGQGFAFAGEPITDKSIIGDGVAIGIRKNEPQLKEQLNTALASIRQSGEYDQIAKKYFNFDIYGE